MSIRRMMLFTLGAKIKNLIEAFKTRVLGAQGEFEAETCLDAQLTDLDNKGLLDSASFVLTPNAYEEGVLFAVKPDKVGTNLLRWSEQFDNASWNKLALSVTANSTTAPDGINTADTLIADGTNNTHRVASSIFSVTTGLTYTISVYAKKNTNNFLQIYGIGFPNSFFANFNLDNGTIGTVGTTTTATITDVGNGWYRCTATGQPTATGNAQAAFNIINSTTAGRGDGNTLSTSVFLWGAQAEQSSTATDYISTTDRAIINGTIGDLTVTRATLGTRVNADGDIEQVPYNLLSRSEEFDNGAWNRQNIASITTNAALSPINTLTADKIIPNSTSSQHRIFQSGLWTNQTTFSVYAKADGYNFMSFGFGGGVAGGTIIFNLSNGTISGTASNFVPSIESVGNGWYRCLITISNNGVGNTISHWIIVRNDNTTNNYVGDGTSGILVWGAQLVVGNQPKDYFPTTNRFNIPRIDYSNGSCPSILVEQATSNQIRNNTMVGAVVGNPGTLPTNWTQSLVGLTHQVVGLGVEKGIEYIDIRLTGTATSIQQRIRFEQVTQIVAANGQTWTLSTYLKTISEPQPPTNYRLRILETDSSGNFVAEGFQTITPTTSFARYSFTRTLNGGATVARVQPILEFTTVSGQTYDFTIRIYGPQMEQLPIATSLIQTSTAAVTRNADVITNTNASTLIGQTEGSVYLEVPLVDLESNGRNFITLFFNNSNWVRFRIRTETLSDVNIQTEWYVNNVFVNQGNANIPRSTSLNKILFTYKIGSQVNFFHNGVKLVSTNPIITEIPPFNQIILGASNFQSAQINEGIKIAAIWKTALTDAQAIQLTTL